MLRLLSGQRGKDFLLAQNARNAPAILFYGFVSLAVTKPKVYIPRILCYGLVYTTVRKFIAAKRKTIRGPSTKKTLASLSNSKASFLWQKIWLIVILTAEYSHLKMCVCN